MTPGPITAWQIEGEKVEVVTLVLGSKTTVDSDCSHKIRRWLLLGRKVMTNLDSVCWKKRHHLANKGLYSQGYGLPNVHIRLWEMGCKEGRTPENWCLQAVVLEKTPESPWIARKSNQSILRTGAETETLVFWSPDVNSWLIGKVPDAEKDWGQKEKKAEDEMAGWHHQCNEHELGQS